ncbi:MAG: sigma 54-interacting transcriptional regulator, partial [Acidobacteria bacterium]|nr:sigma 54-interacting transcriptional regulator [Acidobacteriota bacterium]
MGVRLYADRFLVGCESGAIDLATGALVALRRFEMSVPGMSDAEWLEQCARLAVLRQPRQASLIDYGLTGPLDRFEAHSETCLRVFDGRRARSRGSSRRVVEVVALQPRRAIEQLVEILDGTSGGGLKTVQLVGPEGSGLTTTLLFLAREARIRGYVPVSTSVLVGLLARADTRQAVMPALASRYLLVLHDESAAEDEAADAAVLVRCLFAPEVTGSAGGLVVLATRRMLSGVPLVRLETMSRKAMIKMLGPAGEGFPSRVIRRALDRSCGRPGMFLRNLGLSQEPALPAMAGAHGVLVAREPTEQYGSGLIPFPSHDGLGGDVPLFGPRLLLDESGKWAKAERVLRETRAASERRGMHRAASAAGLQLGVLLLRRGRIKDASDVLSETMRAATGLGLTLLAMRAAACLGYAYTDMGRLHEAENVLRAGRSVAARAGLNEERLLLEMALARCLYWQDRIDEAWILIEPLSLVASAEPLRHPFQPVDASPSCVHEGPALGTQPLGAEDGRVAGGGFVDPAVLAGTVAVRIALIADGSSRAMQIAGKVVERARVLNRSLELALGHYGLGLVHAALGDRAAVVSDVAGVVACARRAGAPLLALRARILAYEGANGGRTSSSLPVPRLRYRAEGLPGLLAARLRLALARDAAPEQAVQLRGNVERWARESGARRLRRDSVENNPWRSVADTVVQVLGRLHESEDEAGAFEQIAADLGRQVRAAGIMIFGRRPRGLERLASFGRGGSRALAERASACEAIVSAPSGDADSGIAVPIQHARLVVGVIHARWSADAEVAMERVQPLLAAAAAALGPAVKLAVEEPSAPTGDGGMPELLGSSAVMIRLRDAIARAAAAPFPVLIEGESGSGKELVARAIHARSDRRGRRFCAVNCAALTDELLEAELFGHARGAFTGALTERPGLFEEADGGVLLLDEVSELSPRAQAKLLRAIQEREIRRVGENFARPVDVRVVGATNRPLRAEAAGGRFRQDLLYRLDVIRLVVPPLRERVEDIPLLAAGFWLRSADRVRSRATLSPSAFAALASHAWPGNVRELQNVLAALAVKAPPRGRIGAALVSGLLSSETGGAPVERLAEARRQVDDR